MCLLLRKTELVEARSHFKWTFPFKMDWNERSWDAQLNFSGIVCVILLDKC